MSAQLDPLIGLRKAKVRSRSSVHGRRARQSGQQFDLLSSKRTLRSMGHVQRTNLVLYYERPAEIARYRDAIESLRDSALSLPASLDLISAVRESYLRSL